MKKKAAHVDVEEYIRGAFERNYQRLRLESGHALSPEIKETALQQVLLYWRKLRDLANAITDTEVRLYLPNQESAKGKRFGIEGIVDIVREETRTVMYDLKTHDPEYIRENLADYEEQLNVYAYIWNVLRGQELSQTAIISTQLPEQLSTALRTGDEASIATEMARWEPVIPIDFSGEHVQKTVEEFGEVVDAIEEGRFNPPGPKELAREEVKGQTFATRMCRNCDVRFSCKSFLDYIKVAGSGGRKGPERFLLAGLTEEEAEERFEAGLV
jgi:hypothetical protein